MKKSLYHPYQKILTEVVKSFRHDAGLTQTELAARLERHQSFISNIESGQRRIDVIELHQICNAIGISLMDFVKKLEIEFSKADSSS